MMKKNGILLAVKTMMKLIVLMGLGVSSGFAVLPAGEKNALLDLWDNTGGSNWTHEWETTAFWKFRDPCEQNWYGVTCNADNTHVIELELNDNNLVGALPSSLGNLTELTYLCLNNNQLTGTIPSSLGNLTELRYLGLNNNQLTGTIPSSLGNLTEFEILFLYSNQLTGSIPSSLGNLTQLRHLDIGLNKLTGTIPSSFGNLIDLESLKMGANKLTGTIPSSLSVLTELKTLHIDHNKFYGPIDTDLASTLSTKLRMDYNYFNFANIDGLNALPADTHLILNKNCIWDIVLFNSFRSVSHVNNVEGKNDQYKSTEYYALCSDDDNDGIPSGADADDDNDGVLDENDAFPNDASESVDTDGDGIGNNADTDDDGDGILDTVELANGTDPLDPTNPQTDNTLSDVQLHAFLGIITNFILNDSALPKPKFYKPTRTITVFENGSYVLSFYAENADSYHITGDDADYFHMDVNYQLRFKRSPDYETKKTYKFTITALNKEGSDTQDVTINIGDRDDSVMWKGLLYQYVTSPKTGRVWLDRNLGAHKVCDTPTNHACYGDYYQWGRGLDGHQYYRSGTTHVLQDNIWTKENKFIKHAEDWLIRSTLSNLYTGVDDSGRSRSKNWYKDNNTICPKGFHVPDGATANEEFEHVKNRDNAFSNFLKLPWSGHRHGATATLTSQNEEGAIWTASHDTGSFNSYRFFYTKNGASLGKVRRAHGFPVRCVKIVK